MNLVLRGKVNSVIVVWDFIRDLDAGDYCSFVCPASGHISESVSTTADKQDWNAKGFHVLCDWGVALDWEIETAESITGQWVGSSLEDYSFRPEVFHDLSEDRSGDSNKGFIIHTLIKREIHSPVGTLFFPDILNMSSSWEVILELMERAGHDSVSQVEGLLNPITMMDINIDIQYSLISLEQFQNSQDTVIDIAEPRGLRLFGMMQPTGPIKGIFGLALSQDRRTGHWPSGIADTVVIKSFHDRTVLLEVEAVQLILKIGFVLRSHILQQVNVLIWVEPCQGLFLGMQVVQLCEFKVNGCEVVVQFVLADDLVCHGHAQWFHWVTVWVVESADHLVEVIYAVFLELHFWALLNLFGFLFKYYKVSWFNGSLICRQFAIFWYQNF